MWYRQYYRRFPHAGYGQMFSSWANEEGITIQKSYGNGCAMRVTALGYACDDLKTLWKETIRVPKGRGKIEISCPKCRTSFVRKT